jgi:hypothetical protein
MAMVTLPLRSRPPEVRLSVSVAFAKLRTVLPVVARLRELRFSAPPAKAAALRVPVRVVTLRLAAADDRAPERVPARIWS